MGTLLALAALAVALWGIYVFNRLVRLRNQMRSGWADIDVQLTRRHDLVPQLVGAVKAYAGHERATLEAVTQLRAQAMATAGLSRLGEVESELEGALGRLFALREEYPELKSNDNFARLQRDLVEVEDHLQYARRFYNGAVRDYQTAIQRVPDLVIARSFSFAPGEFFQAEADERRAANVDFSA